MTIHASTGLRNKMLDTGSLKASLNLGFIKIYAGTEPVTADASLGSATLLCTISNNSTGTGLTMDAAAVAGVLLKNPAEVWSGVNANTGAASFYRHVAPGDTGASSVTEARLQGSIAVAGSDMNLSNLALVAAAPQTLDYYACALPTL